MNPERWQRLKSLFESAIEKQPGERAAYLDEACGADSELRHEIEALLDCHVGDSFLEQPSRELFTSFLERAAGFSLLGRRLGSYEILDRIGAGGMGVVYLARDTRLDRTVALKVLAPQFTGDSALRERLRVEARAAARLSHPGIATVFSLEESDTGLYMVSEYVRGRTLQEILKTEPLPLPRVLDISVQIARALCAAHEQGIVHRDLKPENIMQTDAGAIKVLDFGLAKIEPRSGMTYDPRLTRTGMFVGTPAYASPEQLRGAPVDRNTDIFSFGILLYEMAAGHHPFGEPNSMATVGRILEGEVVPPSRINLTCPKDFDRIVARCLQKRPQDRYPSTTALLAELEALAGARPGGSEKPSTPLFWWQFHQAIVGFGYYGMLYPLWRVKEWLGGVEGSLYFFPALIAVGVAANLRLHLWFTSRFFPAELHLQRRKSGTWMRTADWLFVVMLAVAAVRIHALHAIIATLLMSVAVSSLVAFQLIEPATAKSAFPAEGKGGDPLQ